MSHAIKAAMLLTCALHASAVFAQSQATFTDEQIRTLVEHRLIEKDIIGIRVSVERQVVTLRGTVPHLWARNKAVDRALETTGVHRVINEMTIARAESDASIAEEAAENVRRYVFLTIFDDVDLAVDQGVVVLNGKVTMPHKKDAFADLAARVNGVQEVKNDIKTLPVSTFDDQLRYAIARNIYGDPLFWNLALQVNPPLHIIVEHGRVTLTGVVNSEVERRVAESVARSTFGVFSVENKLRLENNN
jgi:osmotically-inducible protein OsmY